MRYLGGYIDKYFKGQGGNEIVKQYYDGEGNFFIEGSGVTNINITPNFAIVSGATMMEFISFHGEIDRHITDSLKRTRN